jgi:hypothetical protein
MNIKGQENKKRNEWKEVFSYGLIWSPLIKILILLHFYYTKYYIIYSKLGMSIKKFYLMLLYYNLVNISFKLI